MLQAGAHAMETNPYFDQQHNALTMVAMSGGVDSSVSALLLQRAGVPIEGMFMKNWEEDDTDEYCAAATDLADAGHTSS